MGGNSNKELQGARPKISQRHRLCIHNLTYDLDYVSNKLLLNNLQLSTITKELKSLKRVAGEKPPREVGKRVRVRAYKPKQSILFSKKLKIICFIIKYDGDQIMD